MAEADELLDLAERHGLLVVSAPADMLAGEWAQARDLVRAGAIGKVAFGRVQSSHAGAAGLSWPVNPAQFYQDGVGALLDLGPYGLTQITGVLGPARRVMAMSGITVPTRRARGGPFDGVEIPVTAPDNNLVLLDFGDATFAVVDATFNVVASRSPRLELFGLEGTLLVHRPGEAPLLEVYRLDAAPGLAGWIEPADLRDLPGRERTDYRDLARGSLITHLADCLAAGTEPVASGAHARHVLEIMLAAQAAAVGGASGRPRDPVLTLSGVAGRGFWRSRSPSGASRPVPSQCEAMSRARLPHGPDEGAPTVGQHANRSSCSPISRW